jgi:hypothetical protein
MKNKIFLFILLLICTHSMAQQVTLQGKQFYLDGNKFYPMVVNYILWAASENGSYFAAPDRAYSTILNYMCESVPSCTEQIQAQFNYIAGMGFNTVRIMELGTTYIPGTGLVMSYNRYAHAPIIVPLNPSNSADPGMNTLLNIYEQVLEVANAASLKVILCLAGVSKTLDATEVNLRSDFIDALSSHLSNSIYKEDLFAYDLINEPGYALRESPKTKQEACEIVSTWYDIIKANAPHHLVTVGNYNQEEIFSFDPSILKVDFNSLHYYPGFKPFEDRTDPNIQQLARTRSANILYWFNQTSIVPWIIGETGFTASDVRYGISHGLHGKLADMEDYAAFSLDAACHCGASGYSWWQYKDTRHWGESHVWFRENFWGLLARWGDGQQGVYDPFIEKPVVDIFRNYTLPPQSTEPCPADYSPTFDADKLYYNPYRHPRNPGKEIERIVKDQDGNPIKDAIVYVWTHMGWDTIRILQNGVQRDSIIQRDDFYYTHTDINGKFIAIPPRHGFVGTPSVEFPGIACIKISAAGSEVYESPWYAGGQESRIPNPIQLNKIKDNVVIIGETILSGQSKMYKGRKSLTVSNTKINFGGNATFTSAKTITLLPGFTAHAGSYVNMYIAHYGCSEVHSSKESIVNVLKNTMESNGLVESNQITLSFEKDFSENSISVFPNPTNNTVTIQLNSKNEEATLSHIKLYDIFGRVMITTAANANSHVLDVSKYPKGVYFIEITDKNTSYYQKIIIN